MEDRQVYESVQSITGQRQEEPEQRPDDEIVEEGKQTVIDGVSVRVIGIADMDVREVRHHIRTALDMMRKNIETSLSQLDITKAEDGNVQLSCRTRPQKFERIRRITGYLVGDMDRWNNAKKSEERERQKHVGGPGFRQFVQMAREAYDAAMENRDSTDAVQVQQAFLELCRERSLDPCAMASSLLAHTMRESFQHLPPSRDSFEADFLAVCKHHNVLPMDALRAIQRNIASKGAHGGGGR